MQSGLLHENYNDLYLNINEVNLYITEERRENMQSSQ